MVYRAKHKLTRNRSSGHLAPLLAAFTFLLPSDSSSLRSSVQADADKLLIQAKCPEIKELIFDPGGSRFSTLTNSMSSNGTIVKDVKSESDDLIRALFTTDDLGRKNRVSFYLVDASVLSNHEEASSAMVHECQHARDIYHGIDLSGITIDYTNSRYLDPTLLRALVEMRAYNSQLSSMPEDTNNRIWSSAARGFLFWYDKLRSSKPDQDIVDLLRSNPTDFENKVYLAVIRENIGIVTYLVKKHSQLFGD